MREKSIFEKEGKHSVNESKEVCISGCKCPKVLEPSYSCLEVFTDGVPITNGERPVSFQHHPPHNSSQETSWW